jgi:hypothetical protein
VDSVGRRESLEHQGHGEEVRRSLNGRIAARDRLSPKEAEMVVAARTPPQKRVLQRSKWTGGGQGDAREAAACLDVAGRVRWGL